MGYRIDFDVREGALYAVVRGKSSSAHAAWIGQDIAEQARRHATRRLLIDLRGLAGRVGNLATLLSAPRGARALANCKVAVLDIEDNDPYYVFAEMNSRGVGDGLRYFAQPSAALSWLSGSYL